MLQYEGCLSFPGHNAAIRRPQKVTVRAFDRHGKPFTLTGEDMLGAASATRRTIWTALPSWTLPSSSMRIRSTTTRTKRNGGMSIEHPVYGYARYRGLLRWRRSLTQGIRYVVSIRGRISLSAAKVLTAPPVKRTAMAHGIPVFQLGGRCGTPRRRKNIRALAPSWSWWWPMAASCRRKVLAIPQYGCINLHVSLLPRYRGAAPVQWAVINGEKTTGVSIMYLNEGTDTGDILQVSPVEVARTDLRQSCLKRITQGGSTHAAGGGSRRARHRRGQRPTRGHAPPARKEQAHFGFDARPPAVCRPHRGLNPWPVAYFWYGGKKGESAAHFV